MPKHFNVFRRMVLGYILIVGLCIGLITPIAQAEAPLDGSYSSSAPAGHLVDGLTVDERADKIDAFFTSRDRSPLAGYGHAMVVAADTYGVDWRLLPAIATIESDGGRMLCSNPSGANNPFGFGSCKIGFKDFNEAIDTIAMNLGGYNPNTEKHYKGKTLTQVLDAYNPPSVRKDYKKLVTWAMNKIAATDADAVFAANAPTKELAMN